MFRASFEREFNSIKSSTFLSHSVRSFWSYSELLFSCGSESIRAIVSQIRAYFCAESHSIGPSNRFGPFASTVSHVGRRFGTFWLTNRFARFSGKLIRKNFPGVHRFCRTSVVRAEAKQRCPPAPFDRNRSRRLRPSSAAVPSTFLAFPGDSRGLLNRFEVCEAGSELILDLRALVSC